ncbi:pantoate--beta-alanine ligase, partial [candidate division KSB1 bacterium]|nr:pantoate--beta-alanine ligase [candidate division KSB1 bacterium]
RKGEQDLKSIQTEIRETLSSLDGARIDYVEIVDAETLEPTTQIIADRNILIALAVYLKETRLIDNLLYQP